MGLAYLAEMIPQAREELLAQLIAREPANANAIRDSVEEAIQSYRTRGFVCSFGTWYSYINAIGVAFRPTDGSPLVALTCGGISDIVSRDDCLTTVGDALLRTKQQLQDLLENA